MINATKYLLLTKLGASIHQAFRCVIIFFMVQKLRSILTSQAETRPRMAPHGFCVRGSTAATAQPPDST